MDVSDWRKRIDQVDREILALLNERVRFVLELAPLKHRDRIPVHEPKREKQLLANLQHQNQGPLTNEALRRIFEAIIQEMRTVQQTALQSAGGQLGRTAKRASSKIPAARSKRPSEGDGSA